MAEGHLLRRVDRAEDFSFINKLCAPLYSADNGRPAIDPEVLFRMLLVGYLYGIKPEARLEEEINYNMAYKWFCGLGLTEKAPAHTKQTATENTDSDMTQTSTHTSVPSISTFIGKPRTGKATASIAATAKRARPVREDRNALDRV